MGCDINVKAPQKYSNTDGNICGLLSQIQLLKSLKSFEIDMGYKRERANGLKEVIFAAFVPEHGKDADGDQVMF
ncbi:hypothetical protein EYZ11_011083 [Aspergillus tanneri]|uniref:Uncharacterized protein n=1 Tax=Aspergillus tanneri TaxID=1220188 RepID=A0A4S3J954_9EURO|nr:hypothetical protein EYZ11_011083 [Aspergillus tanneri]